MKIKMYNVGFGEAVLLKNQQMAGKKIFLWISEATRQKTVLQI